MATINTLNDYFFFQDSFISRCHGLYPDQSPPPLLVSCFPPPPFCGDIYSIFAGVVCILSEVDKAVYSNSCFL